MDPHGTHRVFRTRRVVHPGTFVFHFFGSWWLLEPEQKAHCGIHLEMGVEKCAWHRETGWEAVLVIHVRTEESLHSNPGGENGLEVMSSGNIYREDRGHLLDLSYPALRP